MIGPSLDPFDGYREGSADYIPFAEGDELGFTQFMQQDCIEDSDLALVSELGNALLDPHLRSVNYDNPWPLFAKDREQMRELAKMGDRMIVSTALTAAGFVTEHLQYFLGPVAIHSDYYGLQPEYRKWLTKCVFLERLDLIFREHDAGMVGLQGTTAEVLLHLQMRGEIVVNRTPERLLYYWCTREVLANHSSPEDAQAMMQELVQPGFDVQFEEVEELFQEIAQEVRLFAERTAKLRGVGRNSSRPSAQQAFDRIRAKAMQEEGHVPFHDRGEWVWFIISHPPNTPLIEVFEEEDGLIGGANPNQLGVIVKEGVYIQEPKPGYPKGHYYLIQSLKGKKWKIGELFWVHEDNILSSFEADSACCEACPQPATNLGCDLCSDGCWVEISMEEVMQYVSRIRAEDLLKAPALPSIQYQSQAPAQPKLELPQLQTATQPKLELPKLQMPAIASASAPAPVQPKLELPTVQAPKLELPEPKLELPQLQAPVEAEAPKPLQLPQMQQNNSVRGLPGSSS